jgi:uncharacterized membrane protein
MYATLLWEVRMLTLTIGTALLGAIFLLAGGIAYLISLFRPAP